jgi:large subunit ribosomal protein L24
MKKGDKVKVIAGKEKGKDAVVARVLRNEGKVVLEGLNMVKRHRKPRQAGGKGSVVEIAVPIDISNVKLADKKSKVAKK